MYIYAISLNYFQNEKFFRQKVRENQNTHFIFNNLLVFSENRAVCEIMWKNVVEPDRPQMATQHGACALHDG
jgi:hypothetical protein